MKIVLFDRRSGKGGAVLGNIVKIYSQDVNDPRREPPRQKRLFRIDLDAGYELRIDEDDIERLCRAKRKELEKEK